MINLFEWKVAFVKWKIIAIKICFLTMVFILICSAKTKDSHMDAGDQFIVKPIGSVQKSNGSTKLVLNKNVAPALQGLEGFSHVWVFWWFDQNDTPENRSILQVHPQGNRENPLTGVFACRSPSRPNPVALTLCRILSVKENTIEIEKIDAFANTPIIDLKPYIPSGDSADSSFPDWLKKPE